MLLISGGQWSELTPDEDRLRPVSLLRLSCWRRLGRSRLEHIACLGRLSERCRDLVTSDGRTDFFILLKLGGDSGGELAYISRGFRIWDRTIKPQPVDGQNDGFQIDRLKEILF